VKKFKIKLRKKKVCCVVAAKYSQSMYESMQKEILTAENTSAARLQPKSDSSDEIERTESAISGFLYKKSTSGEWKKRWFSTKGTVLMYFDSKRKDYVLSAISLSQAGEIILLSANYDNDEVGLFTFELNTIIYTLRAKSDVDAQLWVRVLNKLRQEGIAKILRQHNANKNKYSFNEYEAESIRLNDANLVICKSRRLLCGFF
jgi:hypothetical protein